MAAKGKIVIVTGGHKGIGKEIVRGLMKENGKIYIATRNMIKCKETVDEITKEFPHNPPNSLLYFHCDLADFESIQKFVTEFKKDLRKKVKLHLLICAAEVKWGRRRWTSQGIELQLGVRRELNYIYY